MPPGPKTPSRRLQRLGQGAAIGLSLLAWAPAASAQNQEAPEASATVDNNDFRERVLGAESPAPTPPPAPEPPAAAPDDDEREIDFEADGLEYNSDTDVVTATGDVILR